MLDISVIIVNWNTKNLLLECIASLQKEIEPFRCEIFVVDNASTDHSVEAVRGLYPHVRIIANSTNLGFAKANNIGLAHATGKYVCLVNSDVHLEPDCLVRMHRFMEENTTIGMIGPHVLNSDRSLQPSCRQFPSIWNNVCRALALDVLFPKSRLLSGYMMTYWNYNTTGQVDIVSGCFWMLRRSAMLEVGTLDERFFMYAEDKDYCRRLWQAGWPVAYLCDAEIIHYGGASSGQSPMRFLHEMQRANFLYWRKHHGRTGQLWFVAIMTLHLSIRVIGGCVLFAVKPSSRLAGRQLVVRNMSCIGHLIKLLTSNSIVKN